MTRWASQITLNRANDSSSSRGFTIVELLIVVVVIAILAAIAIVAYNGIRTKAEDVSLQSETRQAVAKVLAYQALNSDKLPADLTSAGFAAGSGRDAYYRLTPDGNDFCLAVNITGSAQRVFSATSTDPVPKRGTCEGYILVPGNSAFGTNDFWVMKYEAKKVDGLATSQADELPWVSISQTDAIAVSAVACDGCHLISEAEWMTLAANVLSVPSNWSGGSVGSGYIYSGHSDGTPTNALVADSSDANGYLGTGNLAGETALTNDVEGNAQRRTLTLSNGEVIWDFAGNVWERTTGTVAGGQSPGLSGETAYAYKEWNNGSLIMNGLPAASRPAAISSTVANYSSTQGIGRLWSNYSETALHGLFRGGYWGNNDNAGVLSLNTGGSPSHTSIAVGFRVAR